LANLFLEHLKSDVLHSFVGLSYDSILNFANYGPKGVQVVRNSCNQKPSLFMPTFQPSDYLVFLREAFEES